MKSLLFVSSGRTGTAAIAANFRQRFPELKCVHEPFGSRLLRIVGNMYATGYLSEKYARIAIMSTHGIRRRLYQRCSLVESNPHICCLLPVIKKLYPDTRIVHVVRDPSTFIISYVNHGAFHGLKGWLGDHIPFWFLKPEHFDDGKWQPWSQCSSMEASAYRWTILNQIIERDAAQWNDRSIRVRYEDLFSEDPGEWIRICEFSGLDAQRWQRNYRLLRTNTSCFKPDTSSTAYVHALASLREYCWDQVDRYGYKL